MKANNYSLLNNIFKLETNFNFNLTKTNEVIAYKKIIENFGIKSVKKYYKINKKNKNSNIYLLQNKNNSYIFRISSIKDKNQLEEQCLVSSKIKKNLFIKLKKNKNNTFIDSKENLIFIAYKKVEGNVYDGNPERFNKLIKNAIILFKELKKNKKNKFKKIQNNKYLIKNDIEIVQNIIKGSFLKHLQNKKIINSKTKKMVLENKLFLKNTFNLLLKLNLRKYKKQLVHNDLNHSNIIINKNKIKFIDLEDIFYDTQQQAIAHLFFKITRHSVFNKKISIRVLKNKYLPKILKLLFNDLKLYNSKEELYLFCILRILSDIAIIIKLYKFKKDSKFMYDLEKKIHNLFELNFILY